MKKKPSKKKRPAPKQKARQPVVPQYFKQLESLVLAQQKTIQFMHQTLVQKGILPFQGRSVEYVLAKETGKLPWPQKDGKNGGQKPPLMGAQKIPLLVERVSPAYLGISQNMKGGGK